MNLPPGELRYILEPEREEPWHWNGRALESPPPRVSWSRPPSGLLEPGMRIGNNDGHLLVFARPAYRQKIFYAGANVGTISSRQNVGIPVFTQEFDVWMPPTAYAIMFGSDMRVNNFLIYRIENAATWTLESPRYLLPLPNLYANGAVCLGHNRRNHPPGKTWQEAINKSMELFWNNTFNLDAWELGGNFSGDWMDLSNDSLFSKAFYRWSKMSLVEVVEEMPWIEATLPPFPLNEESTRSHWSNSLTWVNT